MRLAGGLLLRFDTRRFSGLLFHDPPRTTRAYGPAPRTKIADSSSDRRSCHVSPQPACPSHACTRWRIAAWSRRPRGILALHPPEPAPEPDDRGPDEARPILEESPAQKRDAVPHPEHPRLPRMHDEAQPSQPLHDRLPLRQEAPGIVAEQEEIVDVAHVAPGPKPPDHEVVEAD